MICLTAIFGVCGSECVANDGDPERQSGDDA